MVQHQGRDNDLAVGDERAEVQPALIIPAHGSEARDARDVNQGFLWTYAALQFEQKVSAAGNHPRGVAMFS